MEIAPGVIRFRGVRGANSYGCLTGEGIAVIDTGLPGSGKRILGQIRELGMSPGQVRQIILTHSDIDHAGSAAELRLTTGAPVAVHREDARGLEERSAQKRVKGPGGLLLRLLKAFIEFSPVAPDILLEDGDEIAGLTVIHCPGHTKGSICLYKPGAFLITGDAVLGDRKGLVKGPSRALSADIGQARESLKKLTELEYDILLPGHGKPALRDPSAALRELAARRR
jgi:glyoxylase-like metal-dependent hydrolase (beta-lactamase superfamily II)